MKKSRITLLLILILCLALSFSAFAGCTTPGGTPGGTPDNPDNPSDPSTTAVYLTGISVTKPPKTAYFVGEELSLAGAEAIAHYSDGTTKTVALTESMIDASAVDTDVVGTYTVLVSYTEGDVTVKGSFTVAVAVKVISVEGVKLSVDKTTLDIGDTAKASATVSPADATDASVIYSSSNSSIVAIDAAGNIVAKGAGEATISVTTLDGFKSASVKVTVNAPVYVPPYTLVKTFAELKDAVANVASGEQIRLGADIVWDDDAVITIEAKELLLNLNGFNVTNMGSFALTVAGGAKVTIDDLSALKNGSMTTAEGVDDQAKMIKVDGASLTLAAGTFNTKMGLAVYGTFEAQTGTYSYLNVGADAVVNQSSEDYPYCIYLGYEVVGGARAANGIVVDIYGTVNGAFTLNGLVKAHDQGAPVVNFYDGCVVEAKESGAVYGAGYAIWNVYGGTIVGESNAFGMKAGQLNISGGTVKATGTLSIPTDPHGNGINASGCAIQLESNAGYAGKIEVSITGGTIESANGHAIYEYGTAAGQIKSIDVAGATFKTAGSIFNVTEHCDGVVDVVGEYEDLGFVASIGTKFYTSLDAALAVAKDLADATIDLYADATITNAVTVAGNLTLNTNGFNVDAGAIVANRPFHMGAGASLTINANGSTFTVGEYGLVNVPVDVANVSIALNGGAYVGETANGALIRLRQGNGTVAVALHNMSYDDETGYIISGDGFDGTGTILVKDSAFNANAGFAISSDGTLEMEITGCEIETNGVALESCAMITTISDCTITVAPGVTISTAPSAAVAASHGGTVIVENCTIDGTMEAVYSTYSSGANGQSTISAKNNTLAGTIVYTQVSMDYTGDNSITIE